MLSLVMVTASLYYHEDGKNCSPLRTLKFPIIENEFVLVQNVESGKQIPIIPGGRSGREIFCGTLAEAIKHSITESRILSGHNCSTI